MIGIYKITSPKGRIYIGQSKNIENRWNDYKHPKNYKGQIRLYRSIIKYGLLNHTFEIIEECDFKELNTRERYWQDYYDVLNEGLNCVLTETDVLPRKISKEMKNNMSTRMKKVFADKNTKPLRLNTGKKFNIYDIYGNMIIENQYIQDVLKYLNIIESSSIYNTLRKNRYVFIKKHIVIPNDKDYIEYLFNCIIINKGTNIAIYQIFKTGEIRKCTTSSITRVKEKVLNSERFIYYSKKNDSIYTFIGLINNAVQERNFLNY